MDITILKEIKNELKRFEKKLNEALKKSADNKGYISHYDNQLTDVGNINGTKESGAIKRAALDLKNELTKITK